MYDSLVLLEQVQARPTRTRLPGTRSRKRQAHHDPSLTHEIDSWPPYHLRKALWQQERRPVRLPRSHPSHCLYENHRPNQETRTRKLRNPCRMTETWTLLHQTRHRGWLSREQGSRTWDRRTQNCQTSRPWCVHRYQYIGQRPSCAEPLLTSCSMGVEPRSTRGWMNPTRWHKQYKGTRKNCTALVYFDHTCIRSLSIYAIQVRAFPLSSSRHDDR